MNAINSENKPEKMDLDPATQEKLREFCREFALVLRRITGRVVENDQEGLVEDLGEGPKVNPENTTD